MEPLGNLATNENVSLSSMESPKFPDPTHSPQQVQRFSPFRHGLWIRKLGGIKKRGIRIPALIAVAALAGAATGSVSAIVDLRMPQDPASTMNFETAEAQAQALIDLSQATVSTVDNANDQDRPLLRPRARRRTFNAFRSRARMVAVYNDEGFEVWPQRGKHDKKKGDDY